MADISDLFTASENDGPPQPTTAAEERESGATTLVAESLTSWPTTGAPEADSAVFFITAPTAMDTAGLTMLDKTKLMLWKAVVSGSSLTDLTLMASATGSDIGNAIGDVIQMAPTSSWSQALFEGLSLEHQLSGQHGDINPTSITNSGALTNAGLITANGGITATNGLTVTGGTVNTISYSYVPYKFFGYASSYTTGSAGFSKIPISNKVYDSSSNFDFTTDYRFTAPASAYYIFAAAANPQSTNVLYDLSIYKNGIEYLRLASVTSASGPILNYTTPPLFLEATDYVELWIYCGSGSVTIDGGGTPYITYFSGYLYSGT